MPIRCQTRVGHKESLNGLFEQVLGLLSAEGLLKLERVTQDGTKIQAKRRRRDFGGKTRYDVI